MQDLLDSLSTVPGYDFNMESLLFKPSSKFSCDMIDLFQAVYDHINSLGSVRLDEAFKSTLTFVEKNTAPKLIKTIHTHTGIQIKKVRCRELYFQDLPSASGTFAISFEPPKRNGTKNPVWDASYIVSGNRSKESLKPETAAELSKVMGQFDDLVGRFTPASKINEMVECDLYFDIGAAFFCDKIVHTKLAALSPEEITAIMLHEVGHFITLFSFYKYTVHSMDTMSGAFDHFNQYADEQEKIKFLRTKPYKRLLATQKNKEADKLDALADDVVDRLPDVIQSDSKLVTILTGLIGRLVSCFVTWYVTLHTTVIFAAHMISFKLSKWNQTEDKRSDMSGMLKQQYEQEKLADLYVTSHNMGSSLQSALHKIHSLMIYLQGAPFSGHTDVGRGSTINFHLTNFIGLGHHLLGSAIGEAFVVHEPTAKRIQTIMRQQIDMVRASNTSPQLQRLAIEEYERTYQMAQKQGAMTFLTNFNSKAIQMLVVLANIVPIVASRTTIDYHTSKNVSKMLDQAESLIKNDVAMTAVKVKLRY